MSVPKPSKMFDHIAAPICESRPRKIGVMMKFNPDARTVSPDGCISTRKHAHLGSLYIDLEKADSLRSKTVKGSDLDDF